MKVHVVTRHGPWGDPEPVEFLIGERRIGVIAVLDRWLTHEHGYFKVTGSDGALYILRLDTPSNEWELTLFQDAPQRN